MRPLRRCRHLHQRSDEQPFDQKPLCAGAAGADLAGAGHDPNHTVYLIFERGGGDDPFRQSVDRLIDPLLKPIRQIIPTVGRFDLSPIILIILVEIIAMVIKSLV